MSKKREIDELVGEAVKQGLRFRIQPSGHWKAWNPSPDWFGEKSTKISASPRSDRGVTDARVKLQRIGFRPNRPPKKKRREVEQEQEPIAEILNDIVEMAQAATTDPETALDNLFAQLGAPETPTAESSEKETEEMARIGEIAKLKLVMRTDQVKGDIPVASYVLWQVIQAKMSLDGDGSARTLGGREGHIWSGQRTKVTQELWPEISRGDDTRLTTFLRGSKNMFCITRGTGGANSIWWVADDFDGSYTEASARKTPLEWWREEDDVTDTGHDRVTAEDLEVHVEQTEAIAVLDEVEAAAFAALVEVEPPKEKRFRRPGKYDALTADEDGYFHCTECYYATKSKSGLIAHLSKLKGREHPNEMALQCQFCTDVFPTGKQLARHQARFHYEETGEYFCATCLAYYKENPYVHKWSADHLSAVKATDEAALNRAQLAVEASQAEMVADVATEENVAVVFSEVSGAEIALRQVLTEINELRTRNAELTLNNNTLSTEVADLERRNYELLTQLDEMKFKMVDRFKEFLSQQ